MSYNAVVQYKIPSSLVTDANDNDGGDDEENKDGLSDDLSSEVVSVFKVEKERGSGTKVHSILWEDHEAMEGQSPA